MLHWDIVWKEHEHELEKFNSKQRVGLALVCLEDVLNEYGSYFERALDGNQQYLVESSLKGLKSGASDLETYSKELNEFVDGPLPTGVWDVFMGLLHLINNCNFFNKNDALEVMSFAYQAVLNIEILSKLDKEIRENEVRIIESGNQACVRTLNKQLDFLNQLK
ncbi:hypothetical protein [Duganella sp. Root198D2]|uniref:hypothetical protein n=1 Tax=Duganella sp. Root198D2 TaxID=1736489 RepID=UPI00070DD408|nr:hypothetical protein [Duganella sp. Root198D2]KRB84892.1 hypothetical protein ASE26_29600 [Duganella sp. Root198D2]